MPNTLDLIGKQGITFNRYYVSYPLCCPSRATLLSGRYAHTQRRHLQRPRRAAATTASSATRSTGTTSPSGCRTPATGRSTSASSSTTTAARRLPTETAGPAGLGRLAERRDEQLRRGSTTATRSTSTAASRGRSAIPNYDQTRQGRPGLPRAPAAARRLQLPGRRADPAGGRPDPRLGAGRAASTCSSTTTRPTATRGRRSGRSRRPATTTRRSTPTCRGRPTSTRATSPTSRASSATRHLPRPGRDPPDQASSTRRASSRCARSTTGSRKIIDAPAPDRRARQHLRLLHLRQRLLLRRAPPGAGEVPPL